MLLRRILAGFLTIFFWFFSLGAFLLFAVFNTFTKPSFYEEHLEQPAYDLLIDTTLEQIEDQDWLFQDYFTTSDLRAEIIQAFPPGAFRPFFRNVLADIQTSLDANSSSSFSVDLSPYLQIFPRIIDKLVTQYIEDLPTCTPQDIPNLVNEDGLLTCFPAEANAELIARPIQDQVEKVFYNSVPEKLNVDLTTGLAQGTLSPKQFLTILQSARVVILIVLVVLLVAIGLLVFKTLSLLFLFEGLAFLGAGLLGVLTVYFLKASVPLVTQQLVTSWGGKGETLFQTSLEIFTLEIQKAALVFMVLGTLLLMAKLIVNYKKL